MWVLYPCLRWHGSKHKVPLCRGLPGRNVGFLPLSSRIDSALVIPGPCLNFKDERWPYYVLVVHLYVECENVYLGIWIRIIWCTKRNRFVTNHLVYSGFLYVDSYRGERLASLVLEVILPWFLRGQAIITVFELGWIGVLTNYQALQSRYRCVVYWTLLYPGYQTSLGPKLILLAISSQHRPEAWATKHKEWRRTGSLY